MNKNNKALELLCFLAEGTIKEIDDLRMRLAWLPREISWTTEKLEEGLRSLRKLLSEERRKRAQELFSNQVRPLGQELMGFLDSRKRLEDFLIEELGVCPRCGQDTREDLVNITHALKLCSCLETDTQTQIKLSNLRTEGGFDEITLARVLIKGEKEPFLKLEARFINDPDHEGVWVLYLVLCNPLVTLTKEAEFEAIANSEIF